MGYIATGQKHGWRPGLLTGICSEASLWDGALALQDRVRSPGRRCAQPVGHPAGVTELVDVDTLQVVLEWSSWQHSVRIKGGHAGRVIFPSHKPLDTPPPPLPWRPRAADTPPPLLPPRPRHLAALSLTFSRRQRTVE